MLDLKNLYLQYAQRCSDFAGHLQVIAPSQHNFSRFGATDVNQRLNRLEFSRPVPIVKICDSGRQSQKKTQKIFAFFAKITQF